MVEISNGTGRTEWSNFKLYHTKEKGKLTRIVCLTIPGIMPKVHIMLFHLLRALIRNLRLGEVSNCLKLHIYE